MGFKVIFTEGGLRDYYGCLDYVAFDLQNPLAAQRLDRAMMDALGRISDGAESYALYDHPGLKRHNYRKIHLRRYKYKILFHIDGDVVYIDAILHDKQDVEKALG